MPIQVLDLYKNKKPSLGQRLSAGLQGSLEFGNQILQKHLLDQENIRSLSESEKKKKVLSEMFGENVAEMDPDLQKLYIGQLLKGQSDRDLESFKSKNKQDAFQQKQDFLSQLLSGSNQNQPGSEQRNPNNINQSAQMPERFDPASIPDEVIAKAASIDPNIARSLQHSKDVALREKRAKDEYDLKVERASPEHKREEQLASSQAQADVKYNQTLQELSKQHELKEQSLERLESLNKKGVTGKPFEKLLEKAGLVNLTSDGRREFAADVKNLITDIRSILGGQFSNFEFQTILNAYPSVDFSKEANEAIIKNLKGFQDIKKKEVEYATQLKKENKGKIPFDFQSQVNEKVRDYAASKVEEFKKNNQKIMGEEFGITPGNTLMLDPNGEPLDVPPKDVEKYQSLGATLP